MEIELGKTMNNDNIQKTHKDQNISASKKPDAKHTLMRHWHLLRRIPRYPRRISIDDLCAYLKEEHFDVARRTIERNLNKLSEAFDIANDGAKPAGWYWLRDASALSLPGLTATEALTFKLVRQHLTDLMPVSVLAHLEPFFEQAEREFKSLNQNPLQEWPDKIASVPSSQPLLPPIIDATVQQAVSEALLNNRLLVIHYQSREQEAPAERVVHPLGMVSRGGLIYLIAAAVDDLTTIRLRLMHRIHFAEALDAPAQRPENFDLKEFIDSGQLGFGQGKMLNLKVAFMSETAKHLHDTRLSLDQTIEPYDEGRVLVTATLADTQQLTWWLLGFGDKVEVLEPIELRQKIADIALGMNRRYGN
jgi:predicted DNA-binding transcriptional regulator YafY